MPTGAANAIFAASYNLLWLYEAGGYLYKNIA